MTEAVILSAVRTGIGKFGGSLKNTPAPQLGATVIREAVTRAQLEPRDIQECMMGIVLSAGTGQNPARQSAIAAGLPEEIGSTNVNQVCGSGMKTVMMATNSIKVGEHQVIVAGGMENMSAAPYLLMEARWGYRLNDNVIVDHMVRDGLWDSFNDMHMGRTAEIVAQKFKVTREEADRMAYRSHMRALEATKKGWFDNEIVPVKIKSKREVLDFRTDEGIRPDVTLEALAKLKPAFQEDGVVTAGNASQISDGASALVIASREYAQERGIKPLATIVDYCTGGTKPELIMEAPIHASRALMKRNGVAVDDLDLFAHNEAFATASVAVQRELQVPEEKFNVNGGAIALGHPIGCSGARVLTTLIHALIRKEGRMGLATLCLGGGNAVSMIVKR